MDRLLLCSVVSFVAGFLLCVGGIGDEYVTRKVLEACAKGNVTIVKCLEAKP